MYELICFSFILACLDKNTFVVLRDMMICIKMMLNFLIDLLFVCCLNTSPFKLKTNQPTKMPTKESTKLRNNNNNKTTNQQQTNKNPQTKPVEKENSNFYCFKHLCIMIFCGYLFCKQIFYFCKKGWKLQTFARLGYEDRGVCK